MPTYAYLCESCAHQEDVWQKISDASLTRCTHCGQETFRRQLTAPNFQLKGSGWYVTDFRDGNKSSETTNKPEQAKPSAGRGDNAATASASKSTEATETSTNDSTGTAKQPATASTHHTEQRTTNKSAPTTGT